MYPRPTVKRNFKDIKLTILNTILQRNYLFNNRSNHVSFKEIIRQKF